MPINNERVRAPKHQHLSQIGEKAMDRMSHAPTIGGAKVLVIDNCPQQAEQLSWVLKGQGLQALSTCTGGEALRAALHYRPDVILIGLQGSDEEGFQTTERLHGLTDVPILVITAHSSIDNITRAFEVGADDCLTQPFDCCELVARLYANLRRAVALKQGEDLITLYHGDLVVDPYRHRVLVRQRDCRLTRTEFELLFYLAQNHGRILTHTMILDAVWGQRTIVCKDTLKQFVLSLRKKIELTPHSPQWVLTEPGVGYSLAQ